MRAVSLTNQFKQVEETGDVTINITAWIDLRITHTSLGC